ncbi:hypothetical protein GCK72_011985 [Caenorhabditis remanei]|uniref:Acetyl-CoA carboxylase central domain-containing protein n=1 Tax=Caenorhabditis remanei TaxID=31234 RepID=A0A6A5GLX7_CAERE|nr:hypothetical protein GCK72_011985 [Caenorhabditis remanei]KAF1755535.1 hypothetical protein GCK72_011985 [Caenorhabditis remanei]
MDYPIDSVVNGLFQESSSESTCDRISELIQFFMETDRFFDSRNGFDESVQQLLEKEKMNYERVVDLIHSNTHMKTKEKLILTILGRIIESRMDFGDSLRELLKQMKLR